VAASLNKASSQTHCNVKTLGGNLSVSFLKNKSGFSEIWLKGPALFVFEGEIVLNNFK